MLHFKRNDVSIPRLGFGTFQLKGSDAKAAVKTALETGYRHIDTAAAYENEREVGEAIAESGIPRDEIFLTTKIRPNDIADRRVPQAMDESLSRLGVDHVDLILLHWPIKDMDIADQVEPLAGIKSAGKSRLVGISNYTTTQLEEAIEASEVPIDALQCEYHPELDQDPILKIVRREGMLFTSYSPLGQGNAMDAQVIGQIAEAHGKAPSQVVLRWHVQQENVSTIPKASGSDHIRENFDIFDFELTDAEMKAISDLRRPDGRIVDPDFAPDWDTGVAA